MVAVSQETISLRKVQHFPLQYVHSFKTLHRFTQYNNQKRFQNNDTHLQNIYHYYLLLNLYLLDVH